ncbi:acyl-CoA dehydrogenase family protein [Orrella marina]|uniref:Acyl-CoA dehydrogenase n=1 Tax=Orrella marina TaxID=2163011 RepID=A0A2R4XIJ4_9BURK|nr:acyl-CoA dehydrogenase family protein [Orrella marina]AWB33539.1 acyl-CoA dehydrogenase [Orrella marina]
MQNELFDTMDRQLAEICTPGVIREIEAGGDSHRLWGSIADSGFADLMLSEQAGGAGLGWTDAWSVLFAAGRHAVVVPFGSTLFARAVLEQMGQPVSADKSMAVSGFGHIDSQGRLVAQSVNAVAVADELLVQAGETVYQIATSSPFCTLERTGGPACLDANVVVTQPDPIGNLPVGTIASGLGLVLAIQLAGVADRVLSMTLNYANERQQFGKSIGRFQAVQQQITEMSERVYAMRMASQIGARSVNWQPCSLQAALAKSQTSACAARVASIAHAVHGAIGVTQEYDLQIYTRKLYEWARAGGGEQYWAAQIGRSALESQQELLDFTREKMFGGSPPAS